MATEPLRIRTHQELQVLEDEVGTTMGGANVWIPGRKPFDVKAFVLRQLSALHAVLCLQHIHAPTAPPSGETGGACAYCSYGHANVIIATDTEPVFGVTV